MAILISVPESAGALADLKNIAWPEQGSNDVNGSTVLSFSFEKDLLPLREAALRGAGYRVFSTTSEACVRVEIQMGQCGVLLLCYTIPDAIRREVIELFERHCHSGVVASVMQPFDRGQPVEPAYAY